MEKITRITAATVSGLALSLLLGGASFAGLPAPAVAPQGGVYGRPGLVGHGLGASPTVNAPLPSPLIGGASDRVYAGSPTHSDKGPIVAPEPEPEPENTWALRPTPSWLQLAGSNSHLTRLGGAAGRKEHWTSCGNIFHKANG